MESIKLSKYYLYVKRIIDIIVGLFGLILFSPLILVVAILIKLDSKGPVFFSQERVGKNGKIFKIYKFRTMKKDAEEKTGPTWATDDDPRTTYIGKKLRKTKIDEIPQFVNLLKGDMSLVGPRPERPCFVDKFKKYIPGYERRLDVLPGITGLAQLRNGYDKDAPRLIRKLRFEITYIKKMSLSMDIKLIIETIVCAIKGKL
ncbi:MAG: sugar transferase [bacterium]